MAFTDDSFLFIVLRSQMESVAGPSALWCIRCGKWSRDSSITRLGRGKKEEKKERQVGEERERKEMPISEKLGAIFLAACGCLARTAYGGWAGWGWGVFVRGQPKNKQPKKLCGRISITGGRLRTPAELRLARLRSRL